MLSNLPSQSDIDRGFENLKRNIMRMKRYWKDLMCFSENLTNRGARLVLDNAGLYDDLESIEKSLVGCEQTLLNYLELSSEFSRLLVSIDKLTSMGDFRKFRDNFHTDCEKFEFPDSST